MAFHLASQRNPKIVLCGVLVIETAPSQLVTLDSIKQSHHESLLYKISKQTGDYPYIWFLSDTHKPLQVKHPLRHSANTHKHMLWLWTHPALAASWLRLVSCNEWVFLGTWLSAQSGAVGKAPCSHFSLSGESCTIREKWLNLFLRSIFTHFSWSGSTCAPSAGMCVWECACENVCVVCRFSRGHAATPTVYKQWVCSWSIKCHMFSCFHAFMFFCLCVLIFQTLICIEDEWSRWKHVWPCQGRVAKT